ncbi:MAG: hypothetical protein ABID40_02365 [Candidatus Bipolaricaulota bacterium]
MLLPGVLALATMPVAWAQAGPRALALTFVLDKLMNPQGGIHSLYQRPAGAPGAEVLLQNSSLLMLYAAQVGDRDLMDGQVKTVEDRFLDTRISLLHWRLDEEMRAVERDSGMYANAPGDSLRVVESLMLASELRPQQGYIELALEIGRGLREHNVAEDKTLRSHCSWTAGGAPGLRARDVVLSHLNLVAMAALAGWDPSWEGILESNLAVMLSGATKQGLFYSRYVPGEARYEGSQDSMIQIAQTALHLAKYGRRYADSATSDAAQQFLRFVKKEYTSRGKIPARYDPVTGLPVVDWENLAVYALVVQVAATLGDTDFATTLLERQILPVQQADQKSPVYGAFTSSFDNAYAYDTLEALVAVCTLNPGGIDVDRVPIRSVWYLGWGKDGYLAPSVPRDIRTIQARLCPGFIGISATVYQANTTSTDPHRDPQRTATDEALRSVITQVHRLGMGVVLLPELHPDDGTWEGAIEPADVGTWFEQWREILLHYAELAEETKVEVLLLGAELGTVEGFTDEWERLIVAVRGRYRGKISYSPNFWADREAYNRVLSMTHWRQLDYIGVTGYFELTTKLDPSVQELEAAWRSDRTGQDVVAGLEALSRRYLKPIVFWELGYQSKNGTNIYPWNYPRPGTDDEQEQADAWAAFLNVFWKFDWFKGYGVYAEQVGLPTFPKMYAVLGKRAEAVIRDDCRD